MYVVANKLPYLPTRLASVTRCVIIGDWRQLYSICDLPELVAHQLDIREDVEFKLVVFLHLTSCEKAAGVEAGG